MCGVPRPFFQPFESMLTISRRFVKLRAMRRLPLPLLHCRQNRSLRLGSISLSSWNWHQVESHLSWLKVGVKLGVPPAAAYAAAHSARPLANINALHGAGHALAEQIGMAREDSKANRIKSVACSVVSRMVEH